MAERTRDIRTDFFIKTAYFSTHNPVLRGSHSQTRTRGGESAVQSTQAQANQISFRSIPTCKADEPRRHPNSNRARRLEGMTRLGWTTSPRRPPDDSPASETDGEEDQGEVFGVNLNEKERV
ncbi:hypothetical protein AAHA92_12021 [Salvia divinorum]|uniref:Uncharacterized protein n=1 Tax=Salvia divinorum TaxID=28513 RepID=A0ABD1HML4_SALDI